MKSFPIKRVVSTSRAETMPTAQTMTTHTAGILTRPGSSY